MPSPLGRHRSLALASLVLVALSLHLILLVQGTVILGGCDGGYLTYVDGNRKSKYALECYNLYGPDGVFTWTLDMNNGTTIELATCHEYDNCTTDISSIYVYWLYRFATRIMFTDPSTEFSGTVSCSLAVNGSEQSSASCRTQALLIKPKTNVSDAALGPPIGRSYFYVSTVTPSHVLCWRTVEEVGGIGVLLGTCSSRFVPCKSLFPNFSLGRTEYMSYVTLEPPVTRDQAGKLNCSFFYQNQTESVDSVLNLYGVPRVNNCEVTTSPHNWSAVLSCEVSLAYSSAGVYDFQVTEVSPSLPGYIYHLCPHQYYFSQEGGRSLEVRQHGWVSFRAGLQSYMEATDSQQYYRGRLWYSWRLSPFPGPYRRAIIDVCTSSDHQSGCTGPVDLPRFFPVPTSLPEGPSHNCTGLNLLPEHGSSSSCVCSTRDLGTPAGRLMWLLGNATLASGPYGVTSLSLPSSVLRRAQGELTTMTMITCRLEWIEPRDVTLLLGVAYGPDTVDLEVYQKADEARPLILVRCLVGELNPRTPEMVSWSGPCRGQLGFTCTLDSGVTQVQGQTVTCHVTNLANNNRSAEAATVIQTLTTSLPATTAATAAPSSQDQLRWAAAGAGVAVVVLAVIAVLVVAVVLIVRRRQVLPKAVGSHGSGLGASETNLHGITNTMWKEEAATDSREASPQDEIFL